MKKEKTKEDTEMSISISNCKFILTKPTSCHVSSRYGSLVWNPGFEYDAKVIGFIKDYRRLLLTDLMFCTPACTDHRGTPESPARTCTLEDVEGPVCVSVL
ncbi:hypothetical protein NC651_016823 [Populus alba x Populus x berolinensis]|nr:hypothetical protein NC651_016823 [Populus alba x Populus x berolinensis]